MLEFTSKRERRLWIWTLLIVVAIYSTLGLARTLADKLGDSQLFGVGFFLAGCLLVLATVITQGLKIKPSGIEIAVSLGIAAAYLLVFVRMAIPTERSHLIEYGIVAVFILEALQERKRNTNAVPAPALLAIVATILIGSLDECIQAFIPQRTFDPIDILFNSIAAIMAVSASVLLQWAKKRRAA